MFSRKSCFRCKSKNVVVNDKLIYRIFSFLPGISLSYTCNDCKYKFGSTKSRWPYLILYIGWIFLIIFILLVFDFIYSDAGNDVAIEKNNVVSMSENDEINENSSNKAKLIKKYEALSENDKEKLKSAYFGLHASDKK
ncbi:hypothetical protein KAJ27_20300 [bacterium]|nr:hypothetical protein [bacterium]